MKFPTLFAALFFGVAALGFAQSAAPLASHFSDVYHHLDGIDYVEGCGLVKLDAGALVAAVPIVPRQENAEGRRLEHSHVHLMRSEDAGRTWQEASVLPYYSGVPWTHGGHLYLFGFTPGAKSRNDDLHLLRSDDGGRTWSAPVTLFKGHFWNCHTGMVHRPDRLYWAMDDLSLGKNRGPVAIAGDLTRDPMDPSAWRRSPAVPFPGVPDALMNPKFSDNGSQYLEPNVIEVAGRLKLLAVVKPRGQSTAGLCAMLDLDDRDGQLDLRFTQYHPMPGGQLKFCVEYDAVSKLFWCVANLAVDDQAISPFWASVNQSGHFRNQSTGGNDRRFLMLMYSLDGSNWFQAGCVAQAAKLSQSFMYGKLLIDGDDLAIIARSSIHAPNQHDADYATFHRVKDFRKLALQLVPEPEEK